MGYSKLGKAALLSRLREPTLPASSAQNTGPQADSSSPNAGPSHPTPDDPPVGVPAAVPGAMGPPSLPNTLGSNGVPGTHIPQISASAVGSSLQPPFCGKSDSSSVSGSKRVSSQGQVRAEPSAAKRPRVTASSAGDAALHFPKFARLSDDLGVVRAPVSALSRSAIMPRIKEGVGSQLDGQTQAMATPGKRFKPLTITRPPSASPYHRNEAQLSSCALVEKSANVTAQLTRLWHLDFPAYPEFPLLSPITFPPPLSQRKLIQPWAIILSGLSGRERFQCCLVSRFIRYAGECRVPEHVLEFIHINLNSLFIGLL